MDSEPALAQQVAQPWKMKNLRARVRLKAMLKVDMPGQVPEAANSEVS